MLPSVSRLSENDDPFLELWTLWSSGESCRATFFVSAENFFFRIYLWPDLLIDRGLRSN
jgi:hypothetical protein